MSDAKATGAGAETAATTNGRRRQRFQIGSPESSRADYPGANYRPVHARALAMEQPRFFERGYGGNSSRGAESSFPAFVEMLERFHE